VLDLVVGGAGGLGLTDLERHELAAPRAERAASPAPDRMIA
jgi:hypothetical protein